MKNVRSTDRFIRLALAALVVTVAAVTGAGAQQAATYEIVSTVDPSSGTPSFLLQTRSGQFYGATNSHVFAMAADGSRTTVYTFPPNYPPFYTLFLGSAGALSEGTDGSVYGATSVFDPFTGEPGHIFKIDPVNGSVTIVLPRLPSGLYRMNGLTQARDGRLYVTSRADASDLAPQLGGVWRVEPNGTVTPLPGHPNPLQLLETDDGSLYGAGRGFTSSQPPMTVADEIFQLIPDPVTGSVTRRLVHTFSGPDGATPSGRLIQGADGLIYGTTVNGGLSNAGTIFSLDTAGTLTTLHHFTGADGSGPSAVIQGSDGRLYGTTTRGGTFNLGTIFVMNVTGGLTTLRHMAPSDGGGAGSLMEASDGAFYGIAGPSGPSGGGAIFRLRLATTPPPTDGYVEIVSRHSGKCLDIAGGSTEPGASVLQWSCHGGPNQQWRLEPAGGGAMRIISRHSAQALDVAGGATTDGAAILQWPVHGGDNQAWTLEPAGDGYVRLVVRHSGKAMDVEAGSTADGARVLQWAPHNGANQQWLLRAVGSTATISTQ